MAKLKAVPFILIGTVVHLGLCAIVVRSVMECYMRTECLSPVTKMGDPLLAFPLNLISLIFPQGYARANGFTIFEVILNSLLAVTMIWLLLVQPFVRQSAKKSAA